MIDLSFKEKSHMVLFGDWIEMSKTIPDGSVDLIITSPPYNVQKEYMLYDDDKPLSDYLEWLKTCMAECVRVLKEGGRIAWQVGSTFYQKRYFPLHHWSSRVFTEDLGMVHRCEIIWDKKQITKRTAWGSWKSASDNKILPGFEYIELFCKGNKKIQHKGIDTISVKNFIDWTNAVWYIPPETKWKKKHPATFPEELARRLIEMNSYLEDIVLDPFAGTGTVLVAAKKYGRKAIGVEITEEYCQIIDKRVLTTQVLEWKL